MVLTHDYSHAQQQLEEAVIQSDKLGLKPLSAKAHYLLARTLRELGKQADGQQQAHDALQVFETMRKDPGAEKIFQRSDFKTMYEEATRWSQAAKT
jgi:hypothetical protein